MKKRDDQPSFMRWKNAVDRVMFAGYAVKIVHVGIDDDLLRQHWTEEQTPANFVEWFAVKYDLTPISEMGWYHPESTL